MFNLYDCLGNKINTGDIIMHQNLETGDEKYFLVGKKMMYLYDKDGMIKSESFKNNPIDWSITLVNDEMHKWIRLGTEAEVYDEIFNN